MPTSIGSVRALRTGGRPRRSTPRSTARLEVRAVRRVRPATVRLTLGGPAGPESALDALAAGDYCTVHLPRPGREERDTVARHFTVRTARPARSEIDLDVVRHDVLPPHGGLSPTMHWLAGVRCGDEVEVGVGGRAWRCRPGGGLRLLIADATALPSACASIERLPLPSRVVLVGEVADACEEPDVVSCASVEAVWSHRDGRPAGDPFGLLDALDAALARTTRDDLRAAQAWVAGESASVAVLTRYLVARYGVRPEAITARAYWRREPSLLG